MVEDKTLEKQPARERVEDSSLPTTFDPLRKYLSEVSRYSVLTREQEFEVARKIFEDKDRGCRTEAGHVEPQAGCQDIP